MANHILLISEHAEDHRFAQAVSEATGCELRVERGLEEARCLLESVPVQAVFVDVSPADQLQSLESLFSNLIGKNKVHSIAAPDQLPDLDRLFLSPAVGHLVIRQYTDPAANGRHYARIVGATMKKSPFGIRNLLSAAADVQEISIHESMQKGYAANAVSMHLLEQQCQERIAYAVAGAVDELLMNAIYDAPGAETSHVTARHIAQHNVSLTGKRAVEMHVATDGEYIAVCVADMAGTLDRARVLKHVARSYAGKQQVNVDDPLSGAGLGLALILRSGGSLCFTSQPGERTEVTVFFRRAESFREFREQFRFVSTQIHNARG